MEIEITKYTEKGGKETKFYPILSYKAVSYPESILLVLEGFLTEEGNESRFLEIKKVQFIASCMAAISEKPLLVAFCLDSDGGLCPFLLSDLSGDYHPAGDSFRLIDYRSYSEICEYTGETKLSLSDYISEIISGRLGTNTFLSDSEGKRLNYDQQNTYFEKSEADKKKTSRKK